MRKNFCMLTYKMCDSHLIIVTVTDKTFYHSIGYLSYNIRLALWELP